MRRPFIRRPRQAAGLGVLVKRRSRARLARRPERPLASRRRRTRTKVHVVTPTLSVHSRRPRTWVLCLLGAFALCVVGATAPAQAAAQPPGPGSSWRLIFQDGFNDTSLNTSKWATRYARTGDLAYSNVSNGERQWYKRRNVVEGGGMLRLIAKRERTVSPYTGRVFDYSSGMITSKPSLNFRYGYLEARVKFPKGSGFWPAFWTYPSDPRFNSPEIDVAEYFGDNSSNLFLVYHRQAGGASQRIIRASDWSAYWHTIGVQWGPQRLTWYVDGVKRWTVYDETSRAAYLIANLSIADGVVAPAPTRSTPFPSSYKIDHIKVWKSR